VIFKSSLIDGLNINMTNPLKKHSYVVLKGLYRYFLVNNATVSTCGITL